MKEIDKSLADAVVSKILDAMKKTANKTINSSNVEVYHNGIVTDASDNSNIVVSLSFGGTVEVPNLSGKTLTKGNSVRVYSEKQNLANAYIGLKY